MKTVSVVSVGAHKGPIQAAVLKQAGKRMTSSFSPRRGFRAPSEAAADKLVEMAPTAGPRTSQVSCGNVSTNFDSVTHRRSISCWLALEQ
jgi:hypothetical protein